ncbi:MAG: aldehyde dehydrogenase family protein, partial [bacterium]
LMSDFEYANAPESKAIAKISQSYDLFIGGKFTKPKKGKSFNTINQATEEVLAKISYADELDIDIAVSHAKLAYTKVWSKLPARERGKYLYRIARILQERAREFAVV